MPQSKQRHAEYMRNLREKQRIKQQKEDEFIKKQLDVVKEITKQNKRKELSIFSDSWGREVETNLEPQYERKEGNNQQGCCLWGLPHEPDRPKKSIQDRFKDEFQNHSE